MIAFLIYDKRFFKPTYLYLNHSTGYPFCQTNFVIFSNFLEIFYNSLKILVFRLEVVDI